PTSGTTHRCCRFNACGLTNRSSGHLGRTQHGPNLVPCWARPKCRLTPALGAQVSLSRSTSMKSFHVFVATTALLLFSPMAFGESYVGKYCELDGAETENGVEVTGECYMYSEEYGELEGA